MNQNKQNQIKITFIQSPINQVINNIDSVLQNYTANEQTSNFALISRRLSQNIKKIEQNQSKSNSTKRFNNFKQIKNNIITKDAQTIKLEIQQRLNNLREKSSKNNSQKKLTYGKEKYGAEKQDLVSRRLFQEYPLRKEQSQTGQNQNSLLNCLNEIKEVKKTIKNIKERCKNGTIEPFRKQKIQNYYLNSSSTKKKYINHSGSKYSYTNYRDLSQKKLIELSDRRQRSEKQFNWITNPVAVKQFTIITGQESGKSSVQIALQ